MVLPSERESTGDGVVVPELPSAGDGVAVPELSSEGESAGDGVAVPELSSEGESAGDGVAVPELPSEGESTGDDAPETAVVTEEMRIERLMMLLSVIVVFVVCGTVVSLNAAYSTETIQLGPSSSVLIKANRLFVDSIEVVDLDKGKGAILYGFYTNPPLDVLVPSSEIHQTSLPINTHKEWMYYLNEGSQINISYSLNSQNSSSLSFAIVQGKAELDHWRDRPLSWERIQGNGTIQKAVLESSAYYVAVGNLNSESVEVKLNIRIKALIFNTTEAYYRCVPAQGQCSFQLFLNSGNAAVLTSPGQKLGATGGYCYVEISYKPRWSTFLVGLGGMITLVLAIFCFLSHIGSTEQETGVDQAVGLESETTPLLPHGESVADAQAVNEDADDLCRICLAAPRDCKFLPCTHFVACFACATRIAREAGKCPMCRNLIAMVERTQPEP